MQTNQLAKHIAIYEQCKTFHFESLFPNNACLIQQNKIMVIGEVVCHVSTTTDVCVLPSSLVKVKLSLCLSKLYATKAYGGVEVQLHTFLALATDERDWTASWACTDWKRSCVPHPWIWSTIFCHVENRTAIPQLSSCGLVTILTEQCKPLRRNSHKWKTNKSNKAESLLQKRKTQKDKINKLKERRRKSEKKKKKKLRADLIKPSCPSHTQ